MIVLEFSIVPLGKGESVSPWVARAVGVVKESGLPYKLGPMGTCIEGEWDEVFGVVRKAWQAVSADSNRVTIAIKVDYRQGGSGRLESKIASVERRLEG